ncbi:DUF1217 domain-containing protein [Aquibium sp. A9E412]|uniref:DUF1217 domain-containing protein n=1 Tax=Aquibium sp. A9E412 TaxID=2976767 RepID=UPI0025B1B026|nr:DUF1217 domain-containing protein [Aquibium sp. A9E412]MDN2566608.1 DUF1217 domain-containing protein [Aquibium sp. A9E412]
MINTFTGYRLIASDLPRSIDRIEAQPLVQRETAYYLENIGNVKSIDDLVGDDRLFRYAMKAHGLADMAYAKAFMVKALEGGIDDRESFANSLTDKRYRDFVATFNFARHGEATTIFEKTQQGTVDRYLRQTLEEDAGKTNEGVRLALYFDRKAADITSYYEVLGDPALSQVMRTALGFPPAFAQTDIDKQVALMQDRFDVADFQDPEAVDELLNRFTSLWEISNPSAGTQSPILALFGQPAEFGVSTDVLLTIAQMKR